MGGSGISRMNELCLEANIEEPRVKESGDFFDIEFMRPKISKKEILNIEEHNIFPTDCDQLQIEDKKILIYLLDNGKISKKETLNLIGYGEIKTKEILNELIEKNLIVRVGQARSTYYKLSKS